MKISIPTDGNEVSPHFGRCPEFTLAEVDGARTTKIQRICNPGHSPGAIPEYLKASGVKCIICGGIGARAAGLFESCGIKVIQGVSGGISDVIEAYRNGSLKEGGRMCAPGAGKGYGIDKASCDHTNQKAEEV